MHIVLFMSSVIIVIHVCGCAPGLGLDTLTCEWSCYDMMYDDFEFDAVADPGGGGPGGPGPPPPRCPFNIGPKVGTPPLFLLVDLRWTPVADPGYVCVTGVITP